jgi:dolichol-phosphate mannosyltransferase
MTASPTLVTILVPVFNEEANVRRAYEAVVDVFKTLDPVYRYEIVFTDNHSTDNTYALLQQIAAQDPNVRVIRFARNFGYQRSIFVGFLNARGQCAIQMDCDLQDPPSLFPEMLDRWRKGNQVVYGIRKTRKEGALIGFARKAFYRTIDMLSEDKLPHDTAEFRLIDRALLDQLHLIDDGSPYLRGLIATMGYKQVGFEYDRAARTAGESKFGLGPCIKLALDGIVNHSVVPLRLASLISLGVGFLTLITIGVYLIGRVLFGQAWPAGFATTTVLILLAITLNAMFLGIIGEYLGRIYIQVKRRPLAIIEKSLNLDRIALGATGVSASPQEPDASVISETKAPYAVNS